MIYRSEGQEYEAWKYGEMIPEGWPIIPAKFAPGLCKRCGLPLQDHHTMATEVICPVDAVVKVSEFKVVEDGFPPCK